MADQETIYFGHDNSIRRILKSRSPGGAWEAQALTSVTKITLTIGKKLIESDNGNDDAIQWIKGGYATGEVRIFLGPRVVSPGNYHAWLVVYDAVNTNGLVWGFIPISCQPEVEAT